MTPKLVGRLPRERQSIAFRRGQLDARRLIASEEGHGNVSLVVQTFTDAEIRRRSIVVPQPKQTTEQDEAPPSPQDSPRATKPGLEGSEVSYAGG